jgi:16S rRNA C967 or C1407 C5-methylase (RsmB/RsmF family)/NOL1/NOP2/fmu family ribosome biogenesis protein
MMGLPDRFEEFIKRKIGNEFEAFAASLQEPAPVSIRVNPRKNHLSPADEPVAWSSYGRYLQARPQFTLDPLFHAGSYYVQEASSMFLEQALKQSVNLTQPLNVLDLCASPGGKSTHLLSLLNRESLLVSNDVIRSRAAILSENIQKWGYPNAIVTSNDPADFKSLYGFFDVMVIDAPCSGEGLFRKDPEAIQEWSPENIQLCAGRQKRIISDTWDTLRENGILIYCTCTYNETENEDNLTWLRKDHGVEFVRLSTDPVWGVEEVNSNGLFAYRFFPHRAKGEGFFLSVMRKTDRSQLARLKTRTGLLTPVKKIQERLKAWTVDPFAAKFFQFNDLIFYTPPGKEKEVEFLLQHLKIMYGGTNLAVLKHDKLIPEHALALSVEINKEAFETIEVDKEQALRYLRKDVIQLEGAPVGYTLITHKQIPIGWANVLSNRVNNMYPSDWRIRMGEKKL